ncbi:MAG TPA: hypothetical protein VEC56_00995 [Candidatus Krumholzibacteria bacterium]|nr:hypothetical protein [Candidatus Krumholzibacteria bacterium]
MKKRFALMMCVVCLWSRASVAQDTNYWTLQYGTRGELLGGVVVGSALDMSATFYNPGAIAYVENPSFILTASVFGMQTIKLIDQDPEQEGLTTTSFGPLPSMFAGILPMKWFGGRTAYSFLTRQQLDFRITAREGVVVGRDEPGDTLSVGGEVIMTQNMGENWGGFTWAKKLGERASLGATLYGVYRGQYTHQTQTVEAIGSSGFGASAIVENELDYYDVRTLGKVGVYVDLGRGSVGMSFTTPSASLFGTGSIAQNRSLIGDTDGDGTDDSRAEVAFGEDLDTEYKSPMSVAVGGAYQFKRFKWHATVEYFAAVEQYTLVEAPAPAAGPGVTGIDIEYQGASTSVVNWGLGFEQGFGDDNWFYVSYLTDQSAYQAVDERRSVVATWDINHLNGGVALTFGEAELTLGGGFAWGQNKAVSDVNPGTSVLPQTVVPGGVGYTRLKFIVGFAL